MQSQMTDQEDQDDLGVVVGGVTDGEPLATAAAPEAAKQEKQEKHNKKKKGPRRRAIGIDDQERNKIVQPSSLAMAEQKRERIPFKLFSINASKGPVPREKIQKAVKTTFLMNKHYLEEESGIIQRGLYLKTYARSPIKIPLAHPILRSTELKICILVPKDSEFWLDKLRLRMQKAGVCATLLKYSTALTRIEELRSYDAIYADSTIISKLGALESEVAPITIANRALKDQFGFGQTFTVLHIENQSLSVPIGLTSQDEDDIVENLATVIPQVVENTAVGWTSALAVRIGKPEYGLIQSVPPKKSGAKELGVGTQVAISIEGEASPSVEQVKSAVAEVLAKTDSKENAAIQLAVSCDCKPVDIKLARSRFSPNAKICLFVEEDAKELYELQELVEEQKVQIDSIYEFASVSKQEWQSASDCHELCFADERIFKNPENMKKAPKEFFLRAFPIDIRKPTAKKIQVALDNVRMTTKLEITANTIHVQIATAALPESEIVDNITVAFPHIIETIPGGRKSVRSITLYTKSRPVRAGSVDGVEEDVAVVNGAEDEEADDDMAKEEKMQKADAEVEKVEEEAQEEEEEDEEEMVEVKKAPLPPVEGKAAKRKAEDGANTVVERLTKKSKAEAHKAAFNKAGSGM
ncbi:hypothetical protein DFJ73DRAFT_811368 [Zopfochytrium polystomum]|nr:hypothetical protein DFJ73DRAFT_811368 [Zopfochytrium polystomum]